MTTLPPDPGPDPDLFAPAMLFARRSASGGGGTVKNIKLVALAVDNLSRVSS